MTHQPVSVVSQCALMPGWWLASGDQRRLTGSGSALIRDVFVTMPCAIQLVAFTLLLLFSLSVLMLFVHQSLAGLGDLDL